jgi:hypothetical protein
MRDLNLVYKASPAEILEELVMYYLQEREGLTPHNISELIPGTRFGDIQNSLMGGEVPHVELVDKARLVYEPSKAIVAKLARELMDREQLTSGEIREILASAPLV